MLGDQIPAVGLGTYGLTGNDGLSSMKSAILLGYRHLDTAQTYGTEENAGQAVRGSELPRGSFFITTKITAKNLGRIRQSIRESLTLMGLDHADLVLIHWPAPYDEVSVRSYIGDLARAQDEGLCKLIGVSNFTRRHLDEAIAEIGENRLATNQFEQHVYLQNRVLEDHCMSANIRVTAYMPLAGGNVSDDAVLNAVAQKHGVAASQVALAFLLNRGSIIIPKASSRARQQSNLAAKSVKLDAQDLEAIAGLDCGRRYINPEWGPAWD
ncbi:aldo/keto reductase [Rhizobium sp. YS-1r]|jgi:2,5-diketo-D-gluconate reductase B|uniref:aldo/keto reductase n=1 Tax=Rhizobium sp. YS-1r TaxID=1532558 RepID=UPI00050E3375|nr:aldo/keto reductase [Rhizobium sp. YS-1r]KGE02488.1 hypothetical protein JL39_02890 [Rhizobium sp. YS-1r]